MVHVRLSKVPAIDTALKLSGVAVVMFAFVFVVMVPLYNVLCDVLGINGNWNPISPVYLLGINGKLMTN